MRLRPTVVQSVLRKVGTGPRGRLYSTETHGDFARVQKGGDGTGSGTVGDRIRAQLSESKVVLYMKGLPSSPACGFSWRTVQVLNSMGVEYRAHNVLADEELRMGVKEFADWPTIPQVYVDGEFIGGADIVEGLARSGQLKGILAKAGVVEVD